MRLTSDTRKLRASADVIVASLMTNLFALALPLTILHVFDRVIPNSATATLAAFAGGVTIVALADWCIRTARSKLVSIAGTRFELAAHRRGLERLLYPGADTTAIDRDRLFDLFASIGRMRKFYGSDMAMAMLDVPFIVIFLAAMALISPIFGAGAAALTLVSVICVWLHRRTIVRLSHERQARDRRRHSFLTETLEGAEMIKNLGVEAQMQRRFERLMSSSAAITRDLSGSVNFTQGVTGTIALVSPVVMAAIGAFLVIEGQMTMGGLAAGVLLTGRIIQPTLRLEALIAGERDIRPAIHDVHELISAPIRRRGRRPLERIDEIVLRDVAWTPADGHESVLDGVSLRLRRGECISISGADGSGRSTLLRLMAGHLVPDRGEIICNGVPILDCDPADIAHRIAYLSAEHTLLEGTLLDNLTAFEKERNLEGAFALARELGIDEQVAHHPQGYAMRVGAGRSGSLPASVCDGVTLVSGLVGRPDVLLFDEASVGLDHRTDAALKKLLLRLKREVILVLVTYRPSLRSLADRHFELRDGQLREAPLLLTTLLRDTA